MQYNPNIYHRRSIRLVGFDYTKPGAYFVTVCIRQRECLLGKCQDNQVQLSRYGEVVKFNWLNLTNVYPHVALDAFIIMPNHIHGIIILKDCPENKLETKEKQTGLSEVICSLKRFSARRINQLHNIKGISVWQRGYYEHIIRNERSLNNIREYIVNNPVNWQEDEMHPSQSFLGAKKLNVQLNNNDELPINLQK